MPRRDRAAEMQTTSDPRVADLVRAGRIRVATMPPQYTKDPATGELRGWAIDLAGALAARLGIKAVPIECRGPDKVLERLAAGACDAGFLPNSPSWADSGGLLAPVPATGLHLPGPARLPDPQRRGRGPSRPPHRGGEPSRLDIGFDPHPETRGTGQRRNPRGAYDLLRNGHADAFASTRPQLLDDSIKLPGSDVLEDRYGVNVLALVVPKGQAERLAYLNEFLQDAKASGLVQRAIERAGWRGVRVVDSGKQPPLPATK